LIKKERRIEKENNNNTRESMHEILLDRECVVMMIYWLLMFLFGTLAVELCDTHHNKTVV